MCELTYSKHWIKRHRVYNISLITTLISCLELFPIYSHTISFRYSDILNNDTSQITTHISCSKALIYCEFIHKYYRLTVLALSLKKIGCQINRLVPRRHVTKHAPLKTFFCVLRNPNLHTSCPDPRLGTEVSSRLLIKLWLAKPCRLSRPSVSASAPRESAQKVT